jgi:hypothetical protein
VLKMRMRGIIESSGQAFFPRHKPDSIAVLPPPLDGYPQALPTKIRFNASLAISACKRVIRPGNNFTIS